MCRRNRLCPVHSSGWSGRVQHVQRGRKNNTANLVRSRTRARSPADAAVRHHESAPRPPSQLPGGARASHCVSRTLKTRGCRNLTDTGARSRQDSIFALLSPESMSQVTLRTQAHKHAKQTEIKGTFCICPSMRAISFFRERDSAGRCPRSCSSAHN